MDGHGKRQIVVYLGVFAALLVAVWFMHLKDSSRLTWLFAAAGVMWLAIMIGLTMGDTVARM